jgi:hypothetical protein
LGILLQTNFSGICNDNIFSGNTGGADECINLTGGTTNRAIIEGNMHYGTAALGLRENMSTSGTLFVGKNGFENCTTPYVINHKDRCHGEGTPAVITVTGLTGSYTPDLSIAKLAPGVPVTMNFTGSTGAVTISTITGLPEYSLAHFTSDATGPVTFNRSGTFALAGGSNFVSADNGVLVMMQRTNGGINQIEISRALNL